VRSVPILVLRFLTAGLLGLGSASCGASIQAVYEGDVRFEHCMALDSRPDVKPASRRICWDEWRSFYTFGQTRDRIEYAAIRDRQLNSAVDFDEGDVKVARSSSASDNDPTSALAPPPMLIAVVDAGAAPVPPPAATPVAATAVAEVAVAPPAADCATDCKQTWAFCRDECRTAACDKGCSSKYKRCMKRCF
jgi:hypothetical protein